MRATAAEQTNIQEVVTPGGIKAWLIQNDALPMISVEVSFDAGSLHEPAGKEGIANFTASLLDEGAGEYDAKEFKEQLEAIGARFGAGIDTRTIGVGLTTLSEHKDRAFELMGLALTQPRFDEDAVKRIRDGLLSNIRRGDEEPSTVAWRLFRPMLFGNHPFANNGEGTLKTVGALTAADARQWHDSMLVKNRMIISVVGDISPRDLAKLLDKYLGGLSAGEKAQVQIAVPNAIQKAMVKTKKMDVPQGTVLMGHLGLSRHDPDYYAMLVMNEILGGGVMTSRLGADVREKHGLVYDVRTVNMPLMQSGMYYASLATDNAKVEKALGLVRKHLKKIRDGEVAEDEFEMAKGYLIGSFPMRMDSNNKLLDMLTMMQVEGMGIDYLQMWPKRVAAVKREDIQRVARKLIHPEKMVLVVVGNGPALKAK